MGQPVHNRTSFKYHRTRLFTVPLTPLKERSYRLAHPTSFHPIPITVRCEATRFAMTATNQNEVGRVRALISWSVAATANSVVSQRTKLRRDEVG